MGLSITLWCSCFEHCTLVLSFSTSHYSLVGLSITFWFWGFKFRENCTLVLMFKISSITFWYWGFEHHILVLRFQASYFNFENLNFEHCILVLKLQVSKIAFWFLGFGHFTMIFKVCAHIQWLWGFEHHILALMFWTHPMVLMLQAHALVLRFWTQILVLRFQKHCIIVWRFSLLALHVGL